MAPLFPGLRFRVFFTPIPISCFMYGGHTQLATGVSRPTQSPSERFNEGCQTSSTANAQRKMCVWGGGVEKKSGAKKKSKLLGSKVQIQKKMLTFCKKLGETNKYRSIFVKKFLPRLWNQGFLSRRKGSHQENTKKKPTNERQAVASGSGGGLVGRGRLVGNRRRAGGGSRQCQWGCGGRRGQAVTGDRGLGAGSQARDFFRRPVYNNTKNIWSNMLMSGLFVFP